MENIISYIIAILQSLYNIVAFKIAEFRAWFWGIFMKKIGKGVYIMGGCKILNPRGIEIGNYSGINHHTDIGGRGGLTIGNHVMIGPYCQILTAVHKSDDWKKPITRQGIECKPVLIEDDVWIGTHAVILPGVKIGKGAIIGAGAVVTKDVEPYSLVAGVPARHIRYRFSEKNIQKAKKIDFTNV